MKCLVKAKSIPQERAVTATKVDDKVGVSISQILSIKEKKTISGLLILFYFFFSLLT